MDLKVIKTTREVNISIFYIAYRYKRKYRVICLNILIEAISS
jgi:hypothetical protein